MGNVKEDVGAALAAMPQEDFAAATQDLLAALGYQSERTLPGQTGTVADFIAQFPAPQESTRTEAEIDRLVYALYGLTAEEEIATIEVKI